MGCGCKGGNKSDIKTENSKDSNTTESIFNTVVKYMLKVLMFVVLLLLLPVINLMIIKFIFETLVLNKKVDFKDMLSFLTTKLKPIEKEESVDEISEEELDEYELEEVEVLR